MDIKTRFLFKSELDDALALPIEQGGTGSVTAKGARTKLRLLGTEELNKPNGAVARDAQGFLPRDVFPPEIADPSIPSLFGPATVITGKTARYIITNYDTAAVYTAVGLGGVLTRDVDVIDFTANASPSSGAIIINGRTYPISIVFPDIETPVIESPIEGSVLSFSGVVITASAFSLDQADAVHSESEWELSLNADFTDIVDATISTTDLTQWTPSIMKELTQHFVRCRYRSQSGLVSDWSSPVAFTTGNDGLVNTEIQRITTGDPRVGGGGALSDDGVYALMGSYEENTSVAKSGCVYFYKLVNGVYAKLQTIKEPVVGTGNRFGNWISISPDGALAIIGTYGDGIVVGSAYVYSRSGDVWSFVQKLQPAGILADDVYGATVAISRDKTTLAVGAYRDTNGNGAVYIYTLVGGVWTQQAKLAPSQIDNWQYMGWQMLSISSDGNTLAVGAHNANVNGLTENGCVYVFTRNGSTWTEQAKLVPNDSVADLYFGVSGGISVDGNLVVAGSSTFSVADAGVYVFQRTGTTWAQVQKIMPSDLLPADKFGRRVEFKGTKLLITNIKQTPYANSGEVYAYDLVSGSFVFSNKITPSLPSVDIYFGWRLFLSNDGKTALIPSYSDTPGSPSNNIAIFM
jgi:hypothetical protein